MKYTYSEGVEKSKNIAMPIAFFAALVVAAYGYLNFQAPAILSLMEPADITASRLAALQPEASTRVLYIPKINLETDIAAASSEEEGLKHGAIQRSPLSGDPKQGGNFVVAAHRFKLALNPMQTGVRSAFYHIDKLESGDEVYVDFAGMRYAYRVDTIKKGALQRNQLEAKTDDSRITLYSVEDGSRASAVTARLVGQVVWAEGKPKLKPLDMTSAL